MSSPIVAELAVLLFTTSSLPIQISGLVPSPPLLHVIHLLSIPPCCPLYISEDRVLREEGGGGVEEESSVTCVENSSA